MPLDALCLAAVREELAGRVVGMKIDKVQQPERDVIVLTLRGAGEPCRLLLSAGSSDARVHITEHQFENPLSPPMFCMLLRKHLTGARITAVTQPQAERVVVFTLQAPDALGILAEKRLIIELIGRISNIILADSERIIDCIRRIGGDLSDKRSVLPGMLYRAPLPQTGKRDPYEVDELIWRELYPANSEKRSGTTGEATADKWLLSAFTALSPLICRELSWRAYGTTDMRIDEITDGGAALRREFFALMAAVRSLECEPWILIGSESSPFDFSFIRIMQYENSLRQVREESFSEMLDNFCTLTAQRARLRQRASAMLKMVSSAQGRLARKLASQSEEIKKAREREDLRICADLIMANMHLVGRGDSVLIASDYYAEEGATRSIALDSRKNAQQNAAKYYKEYTKAKNAEKYLSEQIRLGEAELEYLGSVLSEIDRAEGERDLNEIRAELEQTGYIKGSRKGKEKKAAATPMRFISSSGLEITAGKSNVQNDTLTLKTALKSDVWLHAQKIHGSHVIISCRGKAPDEVSLREAAAIAAYYSAARAGGKVAVDYTFAGNVKKPPGGRPGMVIYTNYKTIAASPDEELVKNLSVTLQRGIREMLF